MASYFRTRKALPITVALAFTMGAAAFVSHSVPGLGQQPESAAAATAGKGTAGTMTATFTIEGMTCSSCAKGLQATFRKLPGVSSSKVDYEKHQATLTYDPAKQNAEAFKKIVRDSGYACK